MSQRQRQARGLASRRAAPVSTASTPALRRTPSAPPEHLLPAGSARHRPHNEYAVESAQPLVTHRETSATINPSLAAPTTAAAQPVDRSRPVQAVVPRPAVSATTACRP